MTEINLPKINKLNDTNEFDKSNEMETISNVCRLNYNSILYLKDDDLEKMQIFPKLDNNQDQNSVQCISNSISNTESESESESESNNDTADVLNVNINNKLYFPPPSGKKNYLVPKVFSTVLIMKSRKPNMILEDYEFGIVETLKYKTKFPNTLCYERVCPCRSPYVAPILVSLLEQLDLHIPPIVRMSSGTSQDTIESADALLSTLLRIDIKDKLIDNVKNIYLLNVSAYSLTNTLQVLFQRLKFPLFIATYEFCQLIATNIFDIRYTHFGCLNLDQDIEILTSLSKAIAISSNYQIANLAYFIERCQRWIRQQIKYELDHCKLAKAEKIYADAAGTLSIIYGKYIVGIPKSFIAHKIISDSLPLVDELRRTIFYFLLGLPPFEFWHMWSINTLCFDDIKVRCKCAREAFLSIKLNGVNRRLETLPAL